MAVYRFSALADGQAIRFNPGADILNFDHIAIAGADIRALAEGSNLRVSVAGGTFAGKDVLLLNVTPLQLTTGNVTFANGSRLIFGDDTTAQTADNANNSLVGTSGRDHLSGFGGNDTLNGGTGADRLDGGLGNDMYIVSSGDVLVDAGGVDTVQSSVNWTLSAPFENLTLTGTALAGTGNNLGNVIAGNGANNRLSGGGGNDSLTGGAGADTVNGGSGADTMAGGLHDDVFIVDNAGDVVVELNGGGSNDLVQSSIGYTLPAWVNNLTLTGTAAINGVGNELANRMTGNGAANRLQGGSGDDTLIGGGGNDVLDADAIGNDPVPDPDLESPPDPAMGWGNDQMFGGAGNDTLLGAALNDTLSGGLGNDWLSGDEAGQPSGADSFVFDVTPGAANADTIANFNWPEDTDRILLDDRAHANIGPLGNFAAGDARFAAGAGFTSGRDASDRVVYNTSTGQLYYDADGRGGVAAQLIATLEGAPGLAAPDIVVI